jgi:outer membrane immunogenic protein
MSALRHRAADARAASRRLWGRSRAAKTSVSAAFFAALTGMPGPGSATDLSMKDTPVYVPPPIWTGVYVGGHGGGGPGNPGPGDHFDYNGDPFAHTEIDSTAVIAGLQLGYKMQRGNILLGVEADLGYIGVWGSKTADLPNPTGDPTNDLSATYSLSGGLYGDLTGRVGYAAGNTLLYVKGGAAFLNVNFEADYVGGNCSTRPVRPCSAANPSTFSFDHGDVLWGWTLGVGVEYALSAAWSVKLEYQHFNFAPMSGSYNATDTFNCGPPGMTCPSTLFGETEVDLTIKAMKLGVNYQFGIGEDGLQ